MIVCMVVTYFHVTECLYLVFMVTFVLILRSFSSCSDVDLFLPVLPHWINSLERPFYFFMLLPCRFAIMKKNDRCGRKNVAKRVTRNVLFPTEVMQPPKKAPYLGFSSRKLFLVDTFLVFRSQPHRCRAWRLTDALLVSKICPYLENFFFED